MAKDHSYVRWFADLSAQDVAVVGGKNASLGEMIRALSGMGIRVPDGFAITVDAYHAFVQANALEPKMQALLDGAEQGRMALAKAGKGLRKLVRQAHFPEDVAAAVQQAYLALSQRYGAAKIDVAVRSSATAEDLPQASFAGQHDTYLNITGADALLEACRRCYASLFTDRAMSYRQAQGFDHLQVALSVGVQKMVCTDTGAAGVMFSIDPETGFPSVVVISAAWGLGENVVQGTITPDQYTVFKPLLCNHALRPIIEKTLGSKEKTLLYSTNRGATTRNSVTPQARRHVFVLQDAEIMQLARWACAIEAHYGTPMDIEWARDGNTGEFYIVQARPETVHSRKPADALHTYTLKETGRCLLSGISIGDAIAAGTVCRLSNPAQIDQFVDGAILVTAMTDPDWVPIMQRAKGIITDYGSRTSHAAIVSRELGVPAIVGTVEATKVLQHGQAITLSCAEGDLGYVYDGLLDFEVADVPLDNVPQTQTRLMLNLASPAAAFRWWRLPCAGVGLARMEFIINNIIKIHPMALVHFDAMKDRSVRRQIQRLTRGYGEKTTYFVDHLARGIAKIAASQYPEPVIVRTSDFKTNEYAGLIGGKDFEPPEENPMLGFRGAARYYSDRYQEGFALECQAIQKVRDELGLSNVIVMIPFCRTLEEADRVLAVMAEQGLQRGKNGLLVYVMCEIPANVVQADEFARRFDGFSIGSNDLTQLTLGVDRSASGLAHLFDERNAAVQSMICHLIQVAHAAGRQVGICGQAPSDYPEFAAFLVAAGIDTISLNPDSVITVKRYVALAEQAREQYMR